MRAAKARVTRKGKEVTAAGEVDLGGVKPRSARSAAGSR